MKNSFIVDQRKCFSVSAKMKDDFVFRIYLIIGPFLLKQPSKIGNKSMFLLLSMLLDQKS
jgi:hypothetical protein